MVKWSESHPNNINKLYEEMKAKDGGWWEGDIDDSKSVWLSRLSKTSKVNAHLL